jgi:hypothetical protein
VPSLRFPSDQAVGTLEWPGSERKTPVLATGVVTVSDETEISLDVMLIESVRRVDGRSRAARISSRVQMDGPDGPAEYVAEASESWEITGGTQPIDLGFLRSLPADSITNLHLRSPIVAESFPAVAHLAPGLRRLYLARSDLGDDALPTVAALQGLVYLHSWGNRFTDTGVQQLASLTRLENLYLEEETLSAAAFDFAASLPQLARLGL